MSPLNLYELFESRFSQSLDQPFIKTVSGTSHSYRALADASARLANRLTDLGASPGDRVMVQVEKSPWAVFLYLACMRAGFVFLPLNTGYRADELSYFMQDAEPGVVVASPGSSLADMAGTAPHCAMLTLDADGAGTLTDGISAVETNHTIVATHADDLAAILYTSGTTGRPKGAMLTHGNLASNAIALHQLWGFRPDDVLLHALPIFHTHGLFVAINCTLLNASPMIFLPTFDAGEVIGQMPDATVMMGVPTFYTRLLAHDGFTEALCRDMRLFISGSAPLTAEVHDAFRQRTGHAILERYGMTETNMITSNPLSGERLAGTVGMPLPDVDIRICDDQGDAVEVGDIGNIEVMGPNVFKGYWRNPEKTAEEFCDDGFFKTGDKGRIEEHGYLQIVGRSKDLIISGGFNVYPKEVEVVIDELDGVSESAVIGAPHPDYGEGVIAVVICAPGQTVDENSVIAHAKSHLASYKAPKGVIVLDEIPRNAMGKVEKNKLRQRFEGYFTEAVQ